MSEPARDGAQYDKTLVVLVVVVSLAFAWILWPFYGAILWATILATVFAPAHRRRDALPRRAAPARANRAVARATVAP